MAILNWEVEVSCYDWKDPKNNHEVRVVSVSSVNFSLTNEGDEDA